MPGHLFEDNPFDEGTTRRGTDTPGYPEKPAGTTHSSRSDLSPHEQLERQAEFHSSTQASCVGGFFFLHTLSKFIICRLLSDDHADQGEVVPHYNFDMHFSSH